MLDMVSSPSVGHNKPPGPIELARISIDAMSEFMKDNPVIDTTRKPPAQAKLALRPREGRFG